MIGDIAVTASTVHTPNGAYPLRGSAWWAIDRTTRTKAIPAYAIVLAVVFSLLCLIGLLFLLIKEERVGGYVEVTVQGEGFQHITQVPAYQLDTVWAVDQQVAYVRDLAARA